MKIRYFLLSLAALSLMGCIQDTLRPGMDTDVLRAVIVEETAEPTKAQLLDTPGSRLESFWQAGDQIGVFGNTVSNVTFRVAAEDLSKDRKTADFRTGDAIPSGKLTAYSPWQEGASGGNGSVTIRFPAKQNYIIAENGVVTPDPAANILVADGSKSSGLGFRTVLAVLKIGQIFDTETVVKRVEFRDLSGAAVAGEMKLTAGSDPKAEITGDGKVLTLDLGDGLAFPEGEMRPLFLLVPARNYAKGFEITFIDEKGGKTVRTIGKTGGKTLNRGSVYPIGEITSLAYPKGTKTEWNEGTILLTSETLEKVRVLNVYNNRVLTDENGNPCYDLDGQKIYATRLDLQVHKDLQPAVGSWLVFGEPTEVLPGGGVYKILTCEPLGDTYYNVYAEVDRNVFAPIKNLTVGSEIFDAEGNVIPDAGIDLDLASYLESITDESGNPIPFSLGASGQILLGGDYAAEGDDLDEPETKGKWVGTFSAPKLFFKHEKPNAEVSFGAQLKLGTKVSFCVADGELQYLHLNINPYFELGAEFVLKAEVSHEWPFHLITLTFAPIVIAPGVVIKPSLDLRGEIALGGTVQFSSKVSYTYDMGTFGMSYNTGLGFVGRRKVAEPKEVELQPEMGDVTGSIWAKASLIAEPHLSFYGLLGIGLETIFSLKFGIEASTGAPDRLFLTPELALIPSIATLGGMFTHRFSDFTTNIEFNPIWERYLAPMVESQRQMAPIGSVKEFEHYYYTVNRGDQETRVYRFCQHRGTMATSVNGIYYDLVSKGKTLDPWKVVLDLYEVETGADVDWTYTTLNANDDVEYPWGQGTWKIPFKRTRRVGRYDLMEIPAAQLNDIEKTGVVADAEGTFKSGQPYVYDVVYINKASGKEVDGSGGRNYYFKGKNTYTGSLVFGYYWPTCPLGEYWVDISASSISFDYDEQTGKYTPRGYVEKDRSYEKDPGHRYFTGVSWEQY